MRIMLALTTYYTGPDIRILRAAWDAAMISGANEVRIVTVGETPPVPIPWANGQRVHIGPNPGHQAGERRLVVAAIAEAERTGCDWLVKCAGDCIHRGPNWALDWVSHAKGMEAVIIGDRWPERHNWRATGNTDALLRVMPQTKVFAGSVAFLKETWPLVESGFLERDFEVRIRQGGWWPLVRLISGDEVDQYGEGSQQVWLPKSGPLRFRHCHSAGELP